MSSSSPPNSFLEILKKLKLFPNITNFLEVAENLKERRISGPLFAIVAVARFVYQRRHGQEDQQRVHRSIARKLAIKGDSSEDEEDDDSDEEEDSAPDLAPPVKEWSLVSDDGTKALSLVYYPVEEQVEEATEKLLVLIIPGNPGIPYYYQPLMQELVKKHGRRHEIRCISHCGHVMPWKTHNKSFSLEEQLEQKAFYVSKRLQEDPTLRLVVIGHSIGSYFVLDIARRFPQQIVKLVLMQPAIMHMALASKAKQMMVVFNNYELVVMFVGMIECVIPVTLRRWFVRRLVGSESSEMLQLASISLVNSSVMDNVLGMAANEMKDVTDLDVKLVAQHEDKILFVYSTMDEWVPGEFMQQFQLRFRKAQHRVVPQGHAFMMQPEGTRDMAAHISQWIGDVLDDKEASEGEARTL